MSRGDGLAARPTGEMSIAPGRSSRRQLKSSIGQPTTTLSFPTAGAPSCRFVCLSCKPVFSHHDIGVPAIRLGTPHARASDHAGCHPSRAVLPELRNAIAGRGLRKARTGTTGTYDIGQRLASPAISQSSSSPNLDVSHPNGNGPYSTRTVRVKASVQHIWG